MYGAHSVTREPASYSGGNVPPHGVPRRIEELSKSFIVELAHRLPGIDPPAPQRLTSIYVADACDHTLVEQDFAYGH
jgi:hypothetical protein